CVNDIVCSGAKPLFFLDYIACGKNIPEKTAEIVKGVADGCVQAGCALVGGETAEHPGLMPADEYDLAGFSVGVVEKNKIITKDRICAGDALIGIASSGVHSNGFSLVRKVFKIDEKFNNDYIAELGQTLGAELLTPTKIYVKPLLNLIEKINVHGISHITGGGFYENVPRMLNAGFTAVIEKSKCFKKPIFDLIAKVGNIPERDMFNTFNMGTGIVLALAPDEADRAVEILRSFGEDAAVIGEIELGEDGVRLV
ncbi:MAG: phosphoribosylformylglycinamidine cyclo-ligase, partial [Clostridiales bacterium]|nr:phosphoribosylformylglycinamidine cyclo-ligase [Clostridiales bacterium]